MKLPNRRPCETQTIWFQNDKWHLTVGFHPQTGEPAEAFLYGPKVGSDMWAATQDMCRIVSFQLQDGYDPLLMNAKALRDDHGNPLSIYGVIADALTDYVLEDA